MTMPVLLMRLAGPMQSWGTDSRFTVRHTDREPSKSGVIGLLCAALGIDRDDDDGLARVAACRMGVRVDREGNVARDFHTAGGGEVPGVKKYGVAKASGGTPDTVVSTRYYLAGADFLVGIETADRELPADCHRALAAPHWPLYLGRKSFVPGRPIYIPEGLRDGALEAELRAWPWTPAPGSEEPRETLRLLLETTDPGDPVRRDQPLSFRNGARKFDLRHVHTTLVRRDELTIAGDVQCTSLA